MTDTQDLEIARQVRITSLLGLKDTRRRIATKCPFHAERSASFVIYPDNSYHCFGCGAHGNNALDFVIGLGIPFKEAVAELLSFRYPQS